LLTIARPGSGALDSVARIAKTVFALEPIQFLDFPQLHGADGRRFFACVRQLRPGNPSDRPRAIDRPWRCARLPAMKTPKILLAAATVAALSACATGGTDKPAGPTQLLNITLQPARVSPNPQGALLLSEVTGCYVEYVGKGPTEPVFQFRVGPTQRVPSMEQCLSALRAQPGVTAVAPAK